MLKPLSPEEWALPYARYYDLPMPELQPEDHAFLEAQLSAGQVLPLERIADFITGDPEKMGAPNGYYVFPDGRSYSACTVLLPGVTAQMMEWWFAWLNEKPAVVPPEQGNLRYKIWCPPDHWDHCYLDENDHDAGFRICESLDLGAGGPKQRMISKSADPAALGITPAMQQQLRDAGVSLKFGMGCDEQGNPGGIGINTFRDVEGGCLWASRGWGGYEVKEGKLTVLEPVPPANVPGMRAELIHNLLERRRLAQILPELYRQYGKK